jgi:hypothetical protein
MNSAVLANEFTILFESNTQLYFHPHHPEDAFKPPLIQCCDIYHKKKNCQTSPSPTQAYEILQDPYEVFIL